MTRLVSSDIRSIAEELKNYDLALHAKTGTSLLGIGCHSCNVNERTLRNVRSKPEIIVVPITAGLGVISNFSETVRDILKHLGFSARLSTKSDTSGIALAIEQGADGLFMADDDRFVAIDLQNRIVIDNSSATGHVYAAALDLLAGTVSNENVLVLGCGPVGAAACKRLLAFGADLTLHDLDQTAAQKLQESLSTDTKRIQIANDLSVALKEHILIVDATPAGDFINVSLLRSNSLISAPGVPLGIAESELPTINERLIHDKLELGVSAMAVALLSSLNRWDYFD